MQPIVRVETSRLTVGGCGPLGSVRAQIEKGIGRWRPWVLAVPVVGVAQVWMVRQALAFRRLYGRYRRLVDREAAKSGFLLLAAHELRAPIALVRGYSEIISSGAFGVLSADGRRALDAMEIKLAEMEQLGQDMAEMARLQDADTALKREELTAGELVAEAVERVRPLAGPAHHIEVDERGTPLRLTGDRRRLLTLLANLIGNAVKYSPEGGAIVITSRGHRRQVTISVRDEGVGIPREQIGRLFRPFSRLLQEGARGIPGTGVGLYLCREIARAHAGDLAAESHGKRGSTFVLTLPAA
jgi:signal transduction histidine kinase